MQRQTRQLNQRDAVLAEAESHDSLDAASMCKYHEKLTNITRSISRQLECFKASMTVGSLFTIRDLVDQCIAIISENPNVLDALPAMLPIETNNNPDTIGREPICLNTTSVPSLFPSSPSTSAHVSQLNHHRPPPLPLQPQNHSSRNSQQLKKLQLQQGHTKHHDNKSYSSGGLRRSASFSYGDSSRSTLPTVYDFPTGTATYMDVDSVEEDDNDENEQINGRIMSTSPEPEVPGANERSQLESQEMIRKNNAGLNVAVPRVATPPRKRTTSDSGTLFAETPKRSRKTLVESFFSRAQLADADSAGSIGVLPVPPLFGANSKKIEATTRVGEENTKESKRKTKPTGNESTNIVEPLVCAPMTRAKAAAVAAAAAEAAAREMANEPAPVSPIIKELRPVSKRDMTHLSVQDMRRNKEAFGRLLREDNVFPNGKLLRARVKNETTDRQLGLLYLVATRMTGEQRNLANIAALSKSTADTFKIVGVAEFTSEIVFELALDRDYAHYKSSSARFHGLYLTMRGQMIGGTELDSYKKDGVEKMNVELRMTLSKTDLSWFDAFVASQLGSTTPAIPHQRSVQNRGDGTMRRAATFAFGENACLEATSNVPYETSPTMPSRNKATTKSSSQQSELM